jgi:hypothetical protein
MSDNESNIIKPVDGLHNIAGLTPAERRKERKRRQQLHRQKEQNSDTENNINDEEHLTLEPTEDEKKQSTAGGIDYCA